jgi:hypothetical protein
MRHHELDENRSSARIAVTQQRTRLFVALIALALIQVAHILDQLRWSSTARFPSVFVTEQNGQLGIVLALVACIAVAARSDHGPALAALAGAVVALGFALYHGIPFKVGVNNPYWGPNGHADVIRWLTVLAAIAVGLVVVRLAMELKKTEARADRW